MTGRQGKKTHTQKKHANHTNKGKARLNRRQKYDVHDEETLAIEEGDALKQLSIEGTVF